MQVPAVDDTDLPGRIGHDVVRGEGTVYQLPPCRPPEPLEVPFHSFRKVSVVLPDRRKILATTFSGPPLVEFILCNALLEPGMEPVVQFLYEPPCRFAGAKRSPGIFRAQTVECLI